MWFVALLKTAMASKRIYRSRKDRVIAGVCGGFAEYLDVDPALVRLIMVILIFVNGIGLLLYLIAWFIIPLEPASESDENSAIDRDHLEKSEKGPESTGKARMIVGMVLITLGILFLINQYVVWLSWDLIWPIVLILTGIYLIVNGSGTNE
jgi:phage shock protein C